MEARSGGRCVVRMVHSLFTSSDAWDDQLEGFEEGWQGFFVVLHTYLAHFAGAPAAACGASVPSSAEALVAWKRLVDGVGLAGANTGERRSADGPEVWSGIVEHVHQDARQRYVLVRTDQLAPGLVLVGVHDTSSAGPDGPGARGSRVTVCRFLYGDDAAARAADVEPRWRSWLAEVFETP